MKSLIVTTLVVMVLSNVSTAAAADSAVFSPNARILFQGDSITDGGRTRNRDQHNALGSSYAFIIASKFTARYAERNLTFFNRGVSGNKIPDLAKRWQTNTIELKPTVVSILIGVNDIWHPLIDGAAVSVQAFEEGYDKLLTETAAALPYTKIILCEPFITKGRANSDKWDEWQKHLKPFQAVVSRLGAKHKAPVVKLQAVFDEACKRAPAEYWIYDGVHPSCAGHQLIADEWMRVAAAAWPAKN